MAESSDTHSLDLASMSLGDHLEELRARIILALVGLVIATILTFSMGKYIIRFIQEPYDATIRQYAKARTKDPNTIPKTFAQAVLVNLFDGLAHDPNAPQIDPNLVQYMQAIYTKTFETWYQSPDVLSTMDNAMRLQTLGPSDALLSYMKIALITGLVISAPWVFYQLWMFVAAGLYAHEQKSIRSAVPFSAGLFILGALFFLFVVAPLTLKFFLVFGDMISVTCNWTFEKYITFVTTLMLVFGLAFQTPIAIFILNRTGLIALEPLRKSRKYVFFSVFVIAAIATPPDPMSQVSLAFPLYALFELGILLCVLFNKKR